MKLLSLLLPTYILAKTTFEKVQEVSIKDDDEKLMAIDVLSERVAYIDGLDVYTIDDTAAFGDHLLTLANNGINTFIIDAISMKCDAAASCLAYGALKAWNDLGSLNAVLRNEILNKIHENGGNMILTCGDHKDDPNTIDAAALVRKCAKAVNNLKFDGVNMRLNFRGGSGYDWVTQYSDIVTSMISQMSIQLPGKPFHLTVDQFDLEMSNDVNGNPSVQSQLYKAIEDNKVGLHRLFIRYQKTADPEFKDVFGDLNRIDNELFHQSSLGLFHTSGKMDFDKIIPLKPATAVEPTETRQTGTYEAGYNSWSTTDTQTGFMEACATVGYLGDQKILNTTLVGTGLFSLRVDAHDANSVTFPNNYQAIEDISKLFITVEANGQNCDDENCGLCLSSLSKCDLCNDEWILNEKTFVCEPDCSAMDHCLECSDTETCTKCDSDDYEVKDAECVFVCDVDNCDTCSGPNYCQNCDEGYDLKDKMCNPVCDENCIECLEPNVCGECKENWELDFDNVCRAECNADPNCDFCSGPNICQECLPGFVFDDNQMCVSITDCVDNCAQCKTSTECVVCDKGFYLNSGYCYPNCDDPHCIQCNFGPSYCDICEPNYERDPDTYTCVVPCYVSNCKKCSTPDTCETCESAYALDGGNCASCTDENCLDCSGNKDSCKSCAADYEVEFDDEEQGFCSGSKIITIGISLIGFLMFL